LSHSRRHWFDPSTTHQIPGPPQQIPLRFKVMKTTRAAWGTAALMAWAGAAGADEFDCLIEARQKVEIRSSVEAVIESVRVQRGDFVSKGQVLVTLEAGPERAAQALA